MMIRVANMLVLLAGCDVVFGLERPDLVPDSLPDAPPDTSPDVQPDAPPCDEWFRPAVTIPTCATVSGVASGSFRLGESADLVVACSDNVLIHFNALGAPDTTSLSTRGGTTAVAVFDADANGKDDILATTQDSMAYVSVFSQNFDTTFESRKDWLVGGTMPVAIVAGEVNGDSAVDLITANRGSDNISILLGSGGRTYSPPVVQPVGIAPIALALAPVDSDITLDLLVVTAQSSQLSIRLNTDSGQFSGGIPRNLGTDPTAIAVGDLDPGGPPDLAVVESQSLLLMTNMGGGIFSQPMEILVGPGAKPRGVVFRDLDRDGNADIVVAASGTSEIVIYRGGDDATLSEVVRLPTAMTPFAVVADDFDGDGVLDIATANATGSLSVFKGCR